MAKDNYAVQLKIIMRPTEESLTGLSFLDKRYSQVLTELKEKINETRRQNILTKGAVQLSYIIIEDNDKFARSFQFNAATTVYAGKIIDELNKIINSSDSFKQLAGFMHIKVRSIVDFEQVHKGKKYILEADRAKAIRKNNLSKYEKNN
jgi:hypothetical protein